MEKPLLELRGLKKYFPVTAGILRKRVGWIKAVDGIDVTVNQGQVVGMVGESGSGKSTAGRAAIHLIEPTDGSVIFDGKDLNHLVPTEKEAIRTSLQMIFQDPHASLNPRKTIAETLSDPLLYHKLAANRKEAIEYAAEIMHQVGLHPEYLGRYPHQFSGGQQQRICIGRAIILQPKLIVCDEAVSALDVSIQAQILNLLEDLKARMQLSYLFISHDLNIVRHISDRIVVLYLGKVMESASAEELFRNPKHPYTQALLASAPKTHPNQRSPYVPLKGEIPSPRNPPGGCPFRTRCPYAQPICSETPPKKILKDSLTGKEDHVYHCILP